MGTIFYRNKAYGGGGEASAINDLTDVDITNLADGQILKYDSTSQKWENSNDGGSGSTVSITPTLSSGTKIADYDIDGNSGELYAPTGGGATVINDLSDVDITSPSNGQILKYNSSTQEWENANESGGTTVVANPSGTATAELEKLQVGNDVYSIPLTTEVTDLIEQDQTSWVKKYDYNNSKTGISNVIYGGKKYFSFRCDSNINPATEDTHLEVACPVAIPTTTRKLKVKFSTDDCYSDENRKITIGLKASYNSSYSSYEESTDVDWVYVWSNSQTENYNYDLEFYITPTTPLYFYFIANGWNLELNSVEIVEIGGGASAIDDLADVTISNPAEGQVLTYDATNDVWVNASGGGGTATFSGTSEPTSAIGNNGDLYFQYKEVYRYIKMSITANRDSEYNQCQLSGIRFEDSQGNYFSFADATATCNQSTTVSQGPANVIDNNVNTKLNMTDNSPSVSSPDDIIVSILKGIDLSVYNTWSWWTADDTNQRDPISWKLYVSNDQSTWELLDEQTNYAVTTTRKVVAYSNELGDVGGEPVITNKYVKIMGEWIEYANNIPTRTTLFAAPDSGIVWMDAQGKTLDLNDDIDNYDEIQIIAATTEGDNNYHYTCAQTFMIEDMLVPGVDTVNKGMCIEVMADRSTGIDTSVLRLILVSQGAGETPKRTLWCAGARGIYGAAIHKVIGIKYS